MSSLSSASGVLALLDEPDEVLRVHALKQLDHLVDLYWSEVASAIEKMCVFDRSIDQLIASLVFFD